MPGKNITRELSAASIVEDLWAGWRSQALVTAIELDIFSLVQKGNRTVGQIAAAARATPRGIRGLLDALVGMGYLGKRADSYKLRPVAAKFLVSGRDSYLGSLATLVRMDCDDWSHLTDVVRSGRPIFVRSESKDANRVLPRIASALFDANYFTAREAVKVLPPKILARVSQILDVAANSGAWSIAFAELLPRARVTAIDLPAVLKVTRQFASRKGLANRYSYVAGDIQKTEFSRDTFDLVLLGHVLRGLSRAEARELIRKCAASLRAQGSLLIAEYVPNDIRTGPALPLLFGLDTLLHTRDGDVHTFREVRSWLQDAGLSNARAISLPGLFRVIVAGR